MTKEDRREWSHRNRGKHTEVAAGSTKGGLLAASASKDGSIALDKDDDKKQQVPMCHSSSCDASDFSGDKERCARATMAAHTDRVEMEDVSTSSDGFLMDVVRMRASGNTFNYKNDPVMPSSTATTDISLEDLHLHSEHITYWCPGSGKVRDLGSSEVGAHRVEGFILAHETISQEEDGSMREPGVVSLEASTSGAVVEEAECMLEDPIRGDNYCPPAPWIYRPTGSREFCETQTDQPSPELCLLEATLVDEGETDEEALPQVEATQVKKILCCTINCPALTRRNRMVYGALVMLTLLAAVAIICFSFWPNDPPQKHVAKLESIRKSGVLRCGVGYDRPGMNFLDENGVRSGFDVALCNAIAAAVLGENAVVEFTLQPLQSKGSGRFQTLSENAVDVVAAGITHTMERQVYEGDSKIGYTFSSPYLYQGLQFAGEPKYVECTEKGIKNTEECDNLSVCTIDGTSHQQVLSSLLPGRQLHVVQSFEEMVQALSDRNCLVIAFEGYLLQEENVRSLGYSGDYAVGTTLFSKEPLCLVSRSDDPEWSLFVNAVLHGLFLAEKYNITKATAHLFPETDLFGDAYKNLFKNSLAAAGNYREMYSQYLDLIVPRQAINSINDHSWNASGLMYSHPFGAVSNVGAPPTGHMDQIRQRGKIRCGIIPERQGFAVISPDGTNYHGIEIGLCRALSAALFNGLVTEVDLVPLANETEGYAALHGGLIDVFAGATWSWQSISTYKLHLGSLMDFSPPYFYNSSADDENPENLCLATAAMDHTWSSFVYWVVQALILAEESEISMQNANDMPEVKVFGPNYYRMFRDVILDVGNFGQVYNESLEAQFPREGRNLLNSAGPQIYPLPGMNLLFGG